MKKISEWSDRAINRLGCIIMIVLAALLMGLGICVEKIGKTGAYGSPSPATEVSVDTPEIGTAYIDTLGVATLNPDALLPARVLRMPEVIDDSLCTVWFYPVNGSPGEIDWFTPTVGLTSYRLDGGPDIMRDIGSNYFSTSYPYIILTL